MSDNDAAVAVVAAAAGTHSKPAIRHVEKRRTSTCAFADRVATCVLDVYRQVVHPKPHPTCLGAVVAYDGTKDQLSVLSLGVGTKFLSERILQMEQAVERPYGRRVRDMHGEVLCRRGLKRYLLLRIQRDIVQQKNADSEEPSLDVLERTDQRKWKLRKGFTLHAYFSSTPCGNATIKKFAKLTKEKFRSDLSLWPTELHAPEMGHSIHLGQFALLVKKDATADAQSPEIVAPPVKRHRRALIPDGNIPNGTAPVYSKQGSLHSCSDKVCRWNCVGWQGSLLASVLEEPLQMKSITVGRKFSNICFRRAVCCRIAPDSGDDKTRQSQAVHHPAVMCTAVYVDPDAVIVPQQDGANDLQFTSTRAFVWWSGLTQAHVIDSTTGFAALEDDLESPVCTRKLAEAFLTIQKELGEGDEGADESDKAPQTLEDLRRLKRTVSIQHETEKDELFRHKVMKDWCRRYITDESTTGAAKP